MHSFQNDFYLPNLIKGEIGQQFSVLLERVSHFQSSHVWMLIKGIKERTENSNC